MKINANTVDTLTFETGSSLAFTADQDTFANGKASLSDTTFAKAILTANNKTNSATNNYNLYLNISDNNFTYTQDTNTPELLLQITDASNNSITSIDGLTYKTVTDNKNTSISGFDITNKTGLINLFANREITTTSTKTEEWTIKITFVNYNKDQSANAGKTFSGQILISKDTFDNYTPNTINTLSATKSGANLTVNLNVEQGSNDIDKYYYAIEETNGIALIDNTSKVQRLSNRLAVSNLTYVSSTSSSHTFTNLSSTKDYKVSAYVIDKKKIKSNTYEYNVSSGTYVYPTISKVETSTTSNSITATVTATKGTNNISKYYYSIDSGSTFIESTSNSYTFSNLNGGSYRIMVKVMDTNGKYSNSYVVSEQIEAKQTLVEYIISQYNGIQGNNNIYHHDGTLENGINDGSYRYSGPSDSVNNFVCFGSDAETCPEDNLYRIIGVFDNQVKLIKATNAKSNLLGTGGACGSNAECVWSLLNSCSSDTTAYANNANTIKLANKEIIGAGNFDGCNIWKYSALNTINLNTNFVNNIGEQWANMIATTTWKVGGNTYSKIEDVIPSVTYQNELVTPSTNAVEESKIGLLYVSDYGFAAVPSAWSSKMSSYISSSSTNWLSGMDEWTISFNSAGQTDVFSIVSSGYLWENDPTNNAHLICPVMYLKNSIVYTGGNGTKNLPIRLSD